MSIKTVTLQNFQSHGNTHLEFSDGMNIIHGPSDNGKSSIIRGIRWAVLNKPNGDDFRRHKTDKTFVLIESKNSTIQRTRSDKTNEYEMKGQRFKALRASVPEDISTVLNLSEINIQPQHEIYFLVDDSPGQRSKILNEVAGLQIMDKVLKQVNSEVRGATADIKSTNKHLINTQTVIFDLDWVPKADKFLGKLEYTQDKLHQLQGKYEHTAFILHQLQQLEHTKSNFLSDECVRAIDLLLEKNTEIKKTTTKQARIAVLLSKLNKHQRRCNSITIIDTTELERHQQTLNAEQLQHKRIISLINAINFRKAQHAEIKAELDKTEGRMKNAFKRLGVCPFCGGKT